MDTRADPFLGKMIRGYRLEQLLGRGSATAVYRARTEELWQVPELIVTILLVPEHLSVRAKERFVARFEETARRLSALRHPFLFPLYGYGQQEGIYYLLTPDLQGETLAHHMQKHKRFTPSEILPIFTPIATALSHIHQQGFVYQFLQPANILLVNSANAQVTGLGLSQLLSLHELEDEPTPYTYLKNFTGMFMGAPHYLAPEVVKKGEANPRSDVYSLGILLYEMLSNQSPFSGDDYLTIAQKHVRETIPSFHDAAPDLPVALELIINRALHRTPEQRFQSPDELVAAYAHVLDERLHGPRFFNVVQAVEKIRALPTPTPTPQLRLSAPAQEQQTHATWLPNQTFPAVEHQENVQFRASTEDESLQATETFSSLLPKQQKDEQEMHFVEQDEFPTPRYFSQYSIQKDEPGHPQQQGQHHKPNGPVTAPLNYQDLEKSATAKQAFSLTPAQTGPERGPEEEHIPFFQEQQPEAPSAFEHDTKSELASKPEPLLAHYPEFTAQPATWIASDVEFMPTTRLEPLPVYDRSTWTEAPTAPPPENSTQADQQKAPREDLEATIIQSNHKKLQPASSAQPAAHDDVREMALQLQQMKERLKAQAHKKVPANIIMPRISVFQRNSQ